MRRMEWTEWVVKNIKLIVAVVLILAIALGLWFWWHYQNLHPSTEDAYLRAHIVQISAQVPGQVSEVDVQENQRVKKGQLLFRIDPSQYQNSYDAAKAQEQMAEEASQSSAAAIVAAEQAVQSAQSALNTASQQYARSQALFAKGNISQSVLEQQQSAVAKAKAELDSARSNVTQARTAAASKRDNLAVVRAQLATAKLDLDHTEVKAPADGWIANIDLRKGSTVTAYAPIFALVESGQWWVQANFKETDLSRIRPGQPVTIHVDMLPGSTLKGHVESVGAGSGSTFSLLPSENASGNWVKVTQRFPVRIALDKTDLTLRTGASVSATVNTTVDPGTQADKTQPDQTQSGTSGDASK